MSADVEDLAPADPAPDLAAIERAAAELDAAENPPEPSPAAPGQVAPVAGTSTAAELLGALQLARLAAAPMLGWWDDFGRVWSDQTLQGIAESGALVMERHGWTMSGVMGQWGPYIALIGAVAPPSFVTYQAIRERREAIERAERDARRAANQPQREGAQP